MDLRKPFEEALDAVLPNDGSQQRKRDRERASRCIDRLLYGTDKNHSRRCRHLETADGLSKLCIVEGSKSYYAKSGELICKKDEIDAGHYHSSSWYCYMVCPTCYSIKSAALKYAVSWRCVSEERADNFHFIGENLHMKDIMQKAQETLRTLAPKVSALQRREELFVKALGSKRDSLSKEFAGRISVWQNEARRRTASISDMDLCRYLKSLSDAYADEDRLEQIAVALATRFIDEREIIYVRLLEELLDVGRKLEERPIDEMVLHEAEQSVKKPIQPDALYSEPKKPDEPSLKKPGLFNRKKVEQENAEAQAHYDASLERYRKELDTWHALRSEYDAAMASYHKKLAEVRAKTMQEWDSKEALRTEASRTKYAELNRCLTQIESDDFVAGSDSVTDDFPELQFLSEEYTRTVGLLREVVIRRAELEGLGTIYQKYLSLPAVATMYEYFETGRCDKLAGPDGAYNLFESELRQNMVIAKLDDLSDKLDRIRENQFALYQTVNETNSILSGISRKMDEALDSLSQLEHTSSAIERNTAATAYYTAQTAYFSEVQARLTDSLGYLIALK